MDSLISLLEQKLQLPSEARNSSSLEESLENHVAYLLDHQFEQLTWMLYRLDVDEHLLKKLLADNSETPHKTIAAEIIRRCYQILETRKKHSSNTQSPDWSFDI